MIRPFLLIVLLIGAGNCTQSPPPSNGAATIRVGQPWPQAKRTAQALGYELHDPSQLATAEPIYGFSVDIGPGGLIVERDGRSNTVKTLYVVESWFPKRAMMRIESFTLPPAAAASQPK